MNKKFTLLIAVIVLIIISFIFYRYSNEPTAKVTENNLQIRDAVTEVDKLPTISWETEENPPVGNDIATYSLYLRVDEKVYDIQEYFTEKLYGCRNFTKIDRPEETSPPEASLSDQLCYVMAAGDLFYVVESENGYKVLHKIVGDVPPEDIKEPEILFTF